MTKVPGQGLEALLDAGQVLVKELSFCEPEFQLSVGWAATYDDLFAGHIEQTAEATVLERALSVGRCIVAGRGGGGKTQMLHRIIRLAASQGIVCVLVNLKDWTKLDYGHWDDWTSSDIGAGASFLLERFSQPKVDAISLDYLPPNAKKLLVVDGLNEVMAPVGQKILLALDEFAGDQVGLSVLVADRLTRRTFPSPKRWALASVLPLSKREVSKHCGDEALVGAGAETLGTPYFLDAAIKQNGGGRSPSQMHQRFLVDHGNLSENELTSLAAAAYRLYSETRTRTFSYAFLEQEVGHDVISRLVQSGVVVKLPHADDSQFMHHLVHDYLSAKFVAGLTPTEWTPNVLRTISFDGSSFDTISLVLSQLERGRADKFLRYLYDWNPYAAAYALAEATEEVSGPSEEMKQVIFAMLAEKRFDIVAPTRQRATDALAVVQSNSAARIKTSATMNELFDALGGVESNEDWFNEWVRIFSSESDQRMDDGSLVRLQREDSIIGWTVANVARRLHLDEGQAKSLRAWSASPSAVVRWRVAHVLGAHPSPKNMQVLTGLLKGDEDADVRYGAVRSIIEIAARTDKPALRAGVVDALVNLTPILVRDKKVKEELKRALQIVPSEAPQDWSSVISRVVKSLYVAETSPDEREAWRRYVDLVQVNYPRAKESTS